MQINRGFQEKSDVATIKKKSRLSVVTTHRDSIVRREVL